MKIITIFAMLITTNEDIKKQSCHLHCQSAYSTQSGKPLYLTGVFKMEHYKNYSLELLTGYDPDGNFHVEIFEDIPRYEGVYQSSTFGRVKSLSRKGVTKDRILVQTLNGDGYLALWLYKNNKHVRVSPHILVAKAFIPNPKNLPEVNHIDRIKTNCCVWNLEWNTTRENCIHRSLGKKSSSQYTGVCWDKRRKKWQANIRAGKSKFHLGHFLTEYEAHLAYQAALKQVLETGEYKRKKC